MAACRTRCCSKCSPTAASAPSSEANSSRVTLRFPRNPLHNRRPGRIARLPPSRRVWIFDLDNTLHDARPRIFPSMHQQINAYLRRYFNVDEAGANEIRLRFWRTYGTTLNGLMRHHGADPRHFLRETHVFPELADMVVHENALKHALKLLGGTKF